MASSSSPANAKQGFSDNPRKSARVMARELEKSILELTFVLINFVLKHSGDAEAFEDIAFHGGRVQLGWMLGEVTIQGLFSLEPSGDRVCRFGR